MNDLEPRPVVDRSAAIELQRRSLAAFVRLLARGSASSTLFERDGVLGAIVPACPDRSVINSVTYRDAGSLAAALEELAAAQRRGRGAGLDGLGARGRPRCGRHAARRPATGSTRRRRR